MKTFPWVMTLALAACGTPDFQVVDSFTVDAVVPSCGVTDVSHNSIVYVCFSGDVDPKAVGGYVSVVHQHDAEDWALTGPADDLAGQYTLTTHEQQTNCVELTPSTATGFLKDGPELYAVVFKKGLPSIKGDNLQSRVDCAFQTRKPSN